MPTSSLRLIGNRRPPVVEKVVPGAWLSYDSCARQAIAIASLAAIVSTGCSPTDPAPRAFYGEVHVHGFAGGSHPGALFIAATVPADQARRSVKLGSSLVSAAAERR